MFSQLESPMLSPEIRRLEAMDTQRFDISKKEKAAASQPSKSSTSETVEIPSARNEGLESYDAQRFDISVSRKNLVADKEKKNIVPSEDTSSSDKVALDSRMREDLDRDAYDAQRFDISKKGTITATDKEIESDSTSDQSRKLGELCTVIEPKLPAQRKLFADEYDSASSSETSSLLNRGDGNDTDDFFNRHSIVTGASTPATSDNGHAPPNAMTRKDDQPAPSSPVDDNREIRITDHIIRYGETKSRTIVRPVPSSGSIPSSKSPKSSRPGSPIPVEIDAEPVTEKKEEIKVFLKEEINRAREARFQASIEDFQLNSRPVVQC